MSSVMIVSGEMVVEMKGEVKIGGTQKVLRIILEMAALAGA
jgi:hypothetical protein